MQRDVTKLPWLVVSPFLGVVATFNLNVEAVAYRDANRKNAQVIHRDDYKTQRETLEG